MSQSFLDQVEIIAQKKKKQKKKMNFDIPVMISFVKLRNVVHKIYSLCV